MREGIPNILCRVERIYCDLKKLGSELDMHNFLLGFEDILREERALALITKEEWNSIAISGRVIRKLLKKKLEMKTERRWDEREVREVEEILDDYYEKHYREPISLEKKLEMLAKPRKCYFKDRPWAPPCGEREHLTLHHIIPVRYGGGETSRPELVWMCEFHNKHLKDLRQLYARYLRSRVKR